MLRERPFRRSAKPAGHARVPVTGRALARRRAGDQAATSSGAEAVEAELTTISEVACQAPEAETCAQISAELLSGPDEGSTATFTTRSQPR